MKTLDEILAENTDLTSQVAKLTAQLAEATKHASADLPAIQAKLTAEEAKSKALQVKLDAANAEVTLLKASATDVNQRAAGLVKAMGIFRGDLNEASGEQPKAGESHSPGSWRAEAEKRFQK